MTLTGLKTRTINILNSLDAGYFQNLVTVIEQIEAKSTSGFSDMEAKAKVMYHALTGLLTNQYYHNLLDPSKLLLAQIIFNDFDEISQAQILSSNADISSMSQQMQTKQGAINEAETQQQVFFQFLHSIESFRGHYESRTKSQIFAEASQAHDLFNQLAHDIDMDEDKSTILSKKTAMGTTGLACCVAVCIYGNNKNNKTVLSVSHISTITAEILTELKSRLGKKYSIKPKTMEVYLVGGCIGSLHNEISLLMQTNLGITDMRLGLSDSSLAEGSCVAIMGDNPGQIIYCFDKPVIPRLVISQTTASSSSDTIQQDDPMGTEQTEVSVSEHKKEKIEDTPLLQQKEQQRFQFFFKEHARDESFMRWLQRKEAVEARPEGNYRTEEVPHTNRDYATEEMPDAKMPSEEDTNSKFKM
ncbi:MAG: hypothetical protein P4M14_06285 [Gammaproteobacteria bacterium]|nr:hypothetical protein [Gammaproteobacteria bacterium]